MHNFHKRLREWRLSAGYKTQKSFLAGAERRGFGSIPYFRYNAIERGVLDPSIEEISTICKTLGVTADALLLGLDREQTIEVGELSTKSRRVILRIVEMIKELERP